MVDNKKIVKKWRGSREAYNMLAKVGLLDYWTRYSVKELNNTAYPLTLMVKVE